MLRHTQEQLSQQLTTIIDCWHVADLSLYCILEKVQAILEMEFEHVTVGDGGFEAIYQCDDNIYSIEF